MSQQIFNGFCYRPYDEKKDGWMKNITRIPTYQSFEDSVKMFDELRFYQKRVWELEQKVASMMEYVPEQFRHIYK